MKTVNGALSTHLNTQKSMLSCDLYELRLANGHVFYYADTDKDMEYDGKIYLHNSLLFSRQQIKLQSQVQVDQMTITINAAEGDTIDGVPVMQAAHAGRFDFAKLYLRRCFFRITDLMAISVVGAIGLFGGNVEVKYCGGNELQLDVKARTQGLSQEFPLRKYYPQGAYTTTNGTVSVSGTTDNSCLIAPFVPRKEVLL